MNILNYENIKQVFNKKIFENSRADLLTKLSNTPERYIGLFRPTKPKTKIIQNITQSHEIKFGDAFEILIRKCFEELGYKTLCLTTENEKGETLHYDQLFEKNKQIIFIEQKVRDDHDSTKKRGQVENFEKKINILIEQYDKPIKSYFYFIDPSLKKNRKFYKTELEKIAELYGVKAELTYGKDLFIEENEDGVWEGEVITFLKRWRDELPDMPEVNFDKDVAQTIEEIKDIKPIVYRKLFENQEIVKMIFPIIFPEKKTLQELRGVFQNKINKGGNTQGVYTKLLEKLNRAIKEY